MLRKVWESPLFSCSPDCWLEVDEHPETGFLGCPLLVANAAMVPKFQVATACFSCTPSYLNSSKRNPFPSALNGYRVSVQVCSVCRMYLYVSYYY
jgi:hypothetical protein